MEKQDMEKTIQEVLKQEDRIVLCRCGQIKHEEDAMYCFMCGRELKKKPTLLTILIVSLYKCWLLKLK